MRVFLPICQQRLQLAWMTLLFLLLGSVSAEDLSPWPSPCSSDAQCQEWLGYPTTRCIKNETPQENYWNAVFYGPYIKNYQLSAINVSLFYAQEVYLFHISIF